MEAGKLRHRINIEAQQLDQDEITGEVTSNWVRKFSSVPAAIEPASVREFLAAQQAQSEISTRIVIRYREGILPTMRVRHGKRVYAILGVLPDPVSGREYITLACNSGVTDGS